MRGASQVSALERRMSGSTARGSAIRAKARKAISRTSESSVWVACTVCSRAGTALALPTLPATPRQRRDPAIFSRGEVLDVLVHQAEPVVDLEQPGRAAGRGTRLLFEHGLERVEIVQGAHLMDGGFQQGPIAGASPETSSR